MRWSRYYIPTLKEAPAEAEVVSHKLLLRAGMIRKLTSGIYSWLPLGLRSLEKAKAVVRREMNRAGALELFLPTVQPADLWKESGRWEKYGKELLRFKDRHDRDYCLGPTHEEVITDLLRGELRSYRQLPVNLYQIQTKFRDEIRPRFGLMRGREFLMKDGYSFDCDDAGADASYAAMREAYTATFRGMSLDFRIVEADSGAIGGNFSHEFMVLADTGEDSIVSCSAWPACTWAANVERAPSLAPSTPSTSASPSTLAGAMDCAPMERVSTPGAHSVAQVCDFLSLEPSALIKTLLFSAGGKAVAVLLRGDRELNMVKLKNLLDVNDIEFASPAQVEAWSGAPVGFAGPVGLKGVDKLYADHELAARQGWVAGANLPHTHVRNLSLERDLDNPVIWADLRNVVAGDPCPRCGRPLELKRGIEVGHIFKLGVKYSEAMKAVFLDEAGKERPLIMGCYGIGVSRVVAACIEQNYDENGIMFPPPLAPFDMHLINLDTRNAEVNTMAEAILAFFEGKGLEFLYDDRDERPGVKFKDADLLGLPAQIIVGGKSLARGEIEVKNRRNGVKGLVPAADFAPGLEDFYRGVLQSWER